VRKQQEEIQRNYMKFSQGDVKALSASQQADEDEEWLNDSGDPVRRCCS
jgi:hypothetical protein